MYEEVRRTGQKDSVEHGRIPQTVPPRLRFNLRVVYMSQVAGSTAEHY